MSGSTIAGRLARLGLVAELGDDLRAARKKRTDPHPPPPSRWGQVAEDKSIALDDLAALAGDRLREDRAPGDEGVELALLAAGVDARRELSEQPLVAETFTSSGNPWARRIVRAVHASSAAIETMKRSSGVGASP